MRKMMLAAGALGALIAAGAAGAGEVRIIQTNSRDDVVHLIDPATHAVVGEIAGLPVNHGVAASPDGARLYVTSEAKVTLEVIDAASLEIIGSVALSARPNNISIGKDGRFVYVGVMGGDGGIDVVDTETLTVVRRIATQSRVHNTYVTPDGAHVVAGTFGGAYNLDVIDAASGEILFELYPPSTQSALDGVRPIAFETTPDGSTARMFVQLSNFHGFAVVDFAAREEVARIELPSIPEEERDPGPFNEAPAHGIGVAPDQATLWVCSRLNSHVYAYSLPDLAYLGGVKVGSHPDWLTFTPDSAFVYVANGGGDDVSVVDVAALAEVARVTVGAAPKRNIAVTLP